MAAKPLSGLETQDGSWKNKTVPQKYFFLVEEEKNGGKNTSTYIYICGIEPGAYLL